MTLADIRLVVLDVDGVLTGGEIILGPRGAEYKIFSVLDGQGVRLLRSAGIECAVVSGRRSEALQSRLDELQLAEARLGVRDKVKALVPLLQRLRLEWAQVCCVGDDLLDLPLLERAGFAVAVANAADPVRRAAHYVCRARGGAGALRELADKILRVRRQLGVADCTSSGT